LVGPAASGWLAAHHGYAAPAWGAAGLALLSILTTTFILPHRPPTAPGPSRNFAFGKFFARPLPKKRLLEMFAYGLSFFTITGGLGLYLERQMGYDVEHTGYVYAFSGLVGALVQGGPIGKLAKRFGEEKLSLFAFATMALGYGLLGGVFGLGMLLVLVAVAGVGSALGRPSLTTLLTKAVGPEEQGAILGTSQSLMGVAQIIGPLLAGFLIGHRLLWAYGLAAAAFSLLGAGLRVLLSDGEPQLKAAPG
jgi:DHA1 family tetracycline resistance protein-like MFS transporter